MPLNSCSVGLFYSACESGALFYSMNFRTKEIKKCQRKETGKLAFFQQNHNFSIVYTKVYSYHQFWLAAVHHKERDWMEKTVCPIQSTWIPLLCSESICKSETIFASASNQCCLLWLKSTLFGLGPGNPVRFCQEHFSLRWRFCWHRQKKIMV